MEFGARCQALKLSTPADVGNLSTSQLVAVLAPGARVVKAFNHMTVPNLEANPVVNGARRVAFVSADDDAVKKRVEILLKELAYSVIDLGDLRRWRSDPANRRSSRRQRFVGARKIS